jgi:small-conductance mechanosensitive channel
MQGAWLQSGSLMMDLLTAGGVLLGFAAAMLAVRLLWTRLFKPFVRRTDTTLDDTLLASTRSLVMWGLFLVGLYYALGTLEVMKANERAVAVVGKAFSILWTVLAVWTALRLFNGATEWYVRREAERSAGTRDISDEASFVRKAVTFVVIVIGLLFVLRLAEVDISPLLASGAIGGLAVALALQDTLSNLFAGFFLRIDRPVRIGDFVKLESGEEGFVEEIGWRNTKVRLWANNMVVIPNSTLSKSVLTNYFLPEQEMSVYIRCGVAYDSDLQFVEDVTVDVAKQVLQRVEGAALDFEPVVRWKEFGDSAITFLTVMRVKEFGAQYLLQSEFIKALHRRFKEEGIEIPFPIRTVLLKNGAAIRGNAEASEDMLRLKQ